MTDNLVRKYYRLHGVTLYKKGDCRRAFEVFYKNVIERGDMISLLFLGWMLISVSIRTPNPNLAVRIFKYVIQESEKNTVTHCEAEKLLAFCYLHYDIKYGDKSWARWILAEDETIDLLEQNSFI